MYLDHLKRSSAAVPQELRTSQPSASSDAALPALSLRRSSQSDSAATLRDLLRSYTQRDDTDQCRTRSGSCWYSLVLKLRGKLTNASVKLPALCMALVSEPLNSRFMWRRAGPAAAEMTPLVPILVATEENSAQARSACH